MIRKLLQTGIIGLALSTNHLPAISPIVLTYDEASLAKAIYQDNDDLAFAIIKYKQCYDYNYSLSLLDMYSLNPILDTIIEGDIQKVNAFVKKGCDFNEMTRAIIRLTPEGMFRIAEEGAMQVAIKYSPNSYEMVKILLEAGMDPEQSFYYEQRQPGDEEGDLLTTIETPLSLAYKYNKQDLIKLLQNPQIEMDQKHAKINENYITEFSDTYFRHPLIEAIKKDKLELVKEMISKGIDLNRVSQGVIRADTKGNIGVFEEEGPLQVAIKFSPNVYEAVKLLLEKGLIPTLCPAYVSRDEFLKDNPQVSYVDLMDLALEYQQFDVLELLSQYQATH